MNQYNCTFKGTVLKEMKDAQEHKTSLPNRLCHIVDSAKLDQLAKNQRETEVTLSKCVEDLMEHNGKSNVLYNEVRGRFAQHSKALEKLKNELFELFRRVQAIQKEALEVRKIYRLNDEEEEFQADQVARLN